MSLLLHCLFQSLLCLCFERLPEMQVLVLVSQDQWRVLRTCIVQAMSGVGFSPLTMSVKQSLHKMCEKHAWTAPDQV